MKGRCTDCFGSLHSPERCPFHPDRDLLDWEFDTPHGRAQVVAVGIQPKGFVRLRIVAPDGSETESVVPAGPIRRERGIALAERGVTP